MFEVPKHKNEMAIWLLVYRTVCPREGNESTISMHRLQMIFIQLEEQTPSKKVEHRTTVR
jgi:hypothetical protein